MEVYVLLSTTCFKSRNFSCTKNKLMIWQIYVNEKILRNFWETLEGKLAEIWSIRVEVLQVTRVRHWISCFKPCIVQNWWYFLASADASFVETLLFSWRIYLLFSQMFLSHLYQYKDRTHVKASMNTYEQVLVKKVWKKVTNVRKGKTKEMSFPS